MFKGIIVKEKVSLTFTGERVVAGSTPERIWLDHIYRYEYAKKLVKGKDVLDISCGTGYGSRILCDGGAARVIGLDISNNIIDYASSKYGTKVLEFRVGDILNIDFVNNNFDVITCFETIEHVNNQKKAFMELQRVLRPEGILIISSPNRRLTSPGKTINEQPDNHFHTIEYSTAEFICNVGSYFHILQVYGQRAINRFILLPFIETLLRKEFPQSYSPEKGEPRLEKVSYIKEYRYNIIVCKKKSDNQ